MSDGELGSERTVEGLHAAGLASLLAALRPVVHVAAREYRLALRKRWGFGLTALYAGYSLGMVAFATSRVGPGRFGATLVSLAEVGVYLLPLAALAVGYDVVVGAHERGTLELLFALPATRGAVLVGKYLGRAATLGAALVVGLTPAGVWLASRSGGGLGLYAGFVAAAVGASLGFLAVGALVSAAAGEKTRALGAALAVWAWFVLLHDLAGLGLVTALDLGGGPLAALVLSNPADVFRLLVLGTLPATVGGFAGVLARTGVGTATLWLALAAWIGGPLALATVLVRRRRL